MKRKINYGFEVAANIPIDKRLIQTTLVNRNAIKIDYRYEGMMVYVIETGHFYVLKNGIDNVNWEVFNPEANKPVLDIGLVGSLDGNNTVFTTSQAFEPSTLLVYMNGVLQTLGDDYFLLNGTNIDFVVAPDPTDKLSAYYYTV